MKLSKITLAVLAASSFAGAAQAAVAVTGTAALTSDYLFRGISQSLNKPAVQAGFTATHDSGFYFTAWGSSINGSTTTLKQDSAGIELDTLFGYGFSKGEVAYDVGVMRYNYPGADKGNRTSYNEAYASATYKGAKLGAAYSDDYFGQSGKFTYLYADYNTPINETFGLVAHVGYNRFSNDGNVQFLGGEKYYIDYKLGTNANVAGLTMELAYIGADNKAERVYSLTTAEGKFVNLAEGRAVFTVSKAF